MYTVSKQSSYQTMDALFSSQRDFIVIGLCGLTGSGSSQVAKILQTDFADLGLPKPNSCPKSILFEDWESASKYADDSPELMRARHEYRLLYTFAEKNWDKFSRIKVSALIMARVLSGKPEQFSEFIKETLKKTRLKENGNPNNDSKLLDNCCVDFFNKRMSFDSSDFSELEKNPKEAMKELLGNEISASSTLGKGGVKAEVDKVKFRIYKNGGKFEISNVDLYKLFKKYRKLRKNKSGFTKKIIYGILKKYIYEFLPLTVSEFWREATVLPKGAPDLVMQQLGIDLRISGDPFKCDKFVKNGYEVIAEDINLAIKLLGTYRKKSTFGASSSKQGSQHTQHTLVVVDAIKNPFESLYLKRRYSSYYLLGVYTKESERERRLRKDNAFNDEEISEIGQIESLKGLKAAYREYLKKSSLKRARGAKESEEASKPIDGLLKRIKDEKLYRELPFISQNVDRCLDTADIFINNSYDPKSTRLRLKKDVLRYVCLIMYPGLVLPTPVEKCMQMAYTAKVNSGCISRQVGAVITDSNYHILSIGWNQQPENQLPCSYRDVCEMCRDFDPGAYSDYEKNEAIFDEDFRSRVFEAYDVDGCNLREQGRLPIFCFKDIYNRKKGDENQVHTRSLHGEETAFLNLGPMGKDQARGGFLFTTSSPCELCSKKAMYLGISKIYYIEPYSGISFEQVLGAGPMNDRPKLILLTGAVGRAYMQLYTPLLPLKDEHEMWMGREMPDILLPKKGSKIK